VPVRDRLHGVGEDGKALAKNAPYGSGPVAPEATLLLGNTAEQLELAEKN